jgi:hypothetical protein
MSATQQNPYTDSQTALIGNQYKINQRQAGKHCGYHRHHNKRDFHGWLHLFLIKTISCPSVSLASLLEQVSSFKFHTVFPRKWDFCDLIAG